MLIKNIKVGLNKWRNRLLRSQIEGLNIVKMSVLPQLLYMFDVICIKSPARFFFVDINKIILIFTWKAKTILKKKNEVGGIILYNFKSYYWAIVIKTILVEAKTRRPMEQNRRSRNRPT